MFFPNALEGKVQRFVMEQVRKSKDNDNLFVCRLKNDDGVEIPFAEQWEEVTDQRKSPDHIALFVPYNNVTSYGGMLTFYFAETTAINALRDIRREK